MNERLAILVWAADPDSPHLCATPFHFAAAAAAMDAEVEMYFTARSVRLLVPGVAETLHPGGQGSDMPPLSHFLHEAVRYGARLYACPTAMQAHGVAPEALRTEVRGQAGAAAFIGRTLDPEWRTLTF
ncbi:DsrE family protein [Thauera sp. SDU_THAU2]|uniref:DsrE family protein n=1 Tax=Thauera sp. SDU_THAU2 TaxID=3136633 RepID=UPI00311FD92C